jgi:ribosomal protein S18 acetylase RimI-like enzyme
VRERFRGSGLGRQLAQAALQRALRNGYDLMRLDTLARMDRARQLYAALGFREVPRYYDNPLADAIYLEKPLRPGDRSRDVPR